MDRESICQQWLQLIREDYSKPTALREVSRTHGTTQKVVREIVMEGGLWHVSGLRTPPEGAFTGRNSRFSDDCGEERSSNLSKVVLLALIFAGVVSMLFFIFGDETVENGEVASEIPYSDSYDSEPYYSDHRDDPRYKAGSEEMQGYVDEKMREYDKYCASSADC